VTENCLCVFYIYLFINNLQRFLQLSQYIVIIILFKYNILYRTLNKLVKLAYICNMEYLRKYSKILNDRAKESRRFIQVLAGPRQVGKTTLVRRLAAEVGFPCRYCSGDEAPGYQPGVWLDGQWEAMRAKIRNTGAKEGLLIIDEVHKIPDWSGEVKKHWDRDTHTGLPLKVIILGSAQMLVQKGLSDSLAGRFERIYIPQWSLQEMQEAFGFTLDQYLWYGGYPGEASLIHDEQRWKQYIRESIIRTAIQQDILSVTRIDKPALMAQVFELACMYSGQIVSLQKLAGQLQDTGNVTTVASYLGLLSEAGFITGLQKYAGNALRKRSAPPKLQVHDNALMTALLPYTFEEAKADRTLWGRVIESSVGTHLLRLHRDEPAGLYYWRERGSEVDFISEMGERLCALEIKSGHETGIHKGLEEFGKAYPLATKRMLEKNSSPSWEDAMRWEEIRTIY
jgi:predicted AAA+ superfamily ATPase